MREIKFRCWIPSKKKMFEPTSLEWYKDNCPTRPEDFAFHVAFTYDDDFIFLQFTGLHDKNGKEIYEGDIVKAQDGNWEVFIENLENGVVLSNDKKEEASTKFFDGDYCLAETEVIGNIHENPELLNP